MEQEKIEEIKEKLESVLESECDIRELEEDNTVSFINK